MARAREVPGGKNPSRIRPTDIVDELFRADLAEENEDRSRAQRDTEHTEGEATSLHGSVRIRRTLLNAGRTGRRIGPSRGGPPRPGQIERGQERDPDLVRSHEGETLPTPLKRPLEDVLFRPVVADAVQGCRGKYASGGSEGAPKGESPPEELPEKHRRAKGHDDAPA